MEAPNWAALALVYPQTSDGKYEVRNRCTLRLPPCVGDTDCAHQSVRSSGVQGSGGVGGLLSGSCERNDFAVRCRETCTRHCDRAGSGDVEGAEQRVQRTIPGKHAMVIVTTMITPPLLRFSLARSAARG